MPARLFLSSGDMIADRRFDFACDLHLNHPGTAITMSRDADWL
jgi:hypothetical protein